MDQPTDHNELIPADKLTIRRFLGRGGFASVYAGVLEGAGGAKEQVAVKVLHPSADAMQASEEAHLQMFLREASCTKKQQHRHIIRCHGVCRLPPNHPGLVGISKTAWAIILELAETYTTKTLIVRGMTEARRVYTNLQAYEWLVQIASALAHLHANWPPIIHRDIKHDNVLLKRTERQPGGPGGGSSGGEGRGRLEAKLADLGLHVVVEPDRSVMLRRKANHDGPNRSVHSRPVSQASGLTLNGGGGGGGDLSGGGGGTDSPFLTVTMGHSIGPSAPPSGVASAPPSACDTGAGAVAGNHGGSSVGGGGGVPTVYDIHGALASREFSEAYLNRDPELLLPGGGGAGVGGGGRPAARPGASANGKANVNGNVNGNGNGNANGWETAQGLGQGQGRVSATLTLTPGTTCSSKSASSTSAGGAEDARPRGLSAISGLSGSDAGAPPAERGSPRAAPNKVLPFPLHPESSPSSSWRGRGEAPAPAAPVATPEALTQALTQARPQPDPATRTSSPVNGPRSRPASPSHPSARPPSQQQLRQLPPPPTSPRQTAPLLELSAAAAAAASQPEPKEEAPLVPAASFAHSFPPGAIPYAPSLPRPGGFPHGGAATATATAANANAVISTTSQTRPSGSAPADGACCDLVWAASHRPGSQPRRSLNGGCLAPRIPPVEDTSGGDSKSRGGGGACRSAGDAGGSGLGKRPASPPYPDLASPFAAAAADLANSPRLDDADVEQPAAAGAAAAEAGGLREAGEAAGAGAAAAVAAVAAGAAGRPSPQRDAHEALEPVESIGAILTRNPHLVQPLDLGAATQPSAVPGLRRVRSLMRQFRASELRHLRHASVEWVFGLTGRAGSCMYMAPEVFRQLPYNEKADVFSFGVLSYELLARELLLVSLFNTSKGAKLGLAKPEDYAELVCQGYRPPRPACLPEPAWELVERCWHDDPVQRPAMREVVRRLTALRDEEAAHPTDPRVMPGCAGGCTLQ